jgi:hypothetical protein
MSANGEQPLIRGEVDDSREYIHKGLWLVEGRTRVLALRVRDIKTNRWASVELRGGSEGGKIHGFVRQGDIVNVYGREESGIIRAERIFNEITNSTVSPNRLFDEPGGPVELLVQGRAKDILERQWPRRGSLSPRTHLTFRVLSVPNGKSVLRAVSMECRNIEGRIWDNDLVEVYGRENGFGTIEAKRVLDKDTGVEMHCPGELANL